MTAPQTERGRLSVEALRGRVFIPVPEAAQVFEVDPRTLRRGIEAGEIPAVKIAGSWRLPVAKLLALASVDDEPATDQPGAPAAPAVLDRWCGVIQGPALPSSQIAGDVIALADNLRVGAPGPRPQDHFQHAHASGMSIS